MTTLRERLTTALNSDTGADAAIAAIREHIANDNDAPHEVFRWVSLRQAAAETPIKFVRRIVGAWFDEAAPAPEVEEAA